jgi:hypothetical protein
MTTKALPAIGSTVIAKYIPHVTATTVDNGCTGQAIVVTRVDDNKWTWDNAASVDISSSMPAVYGMFKRTDRSSDVEYYCTDWEVVDPESIPYPPDMIVIEPAVEPTVIPTVTEVDRLESRVTDLSARVTQLDAARNLERTTAINAFKVVSDRLIEEANNRSWCEVYDQIARDVNDDLPNHLQLEIRERDFNLTARLTITLTLTTTETARSIEDAIEMADANNLTEMIMSQVRYGDYSVEEMDWEED